MLARPDDEILRVVCVPLSDSPVIQNSVTFAKSQDHSGWCDHPRVVLVVCDKDTTKAARGRCARPPPPTKVGRIKVFGEHETNDGGSTSLVQAIGRHLAVACRLTGCLPRNRIIPEQQKCLPNTLAPYRPFRTVGSLSLSKLEHVVPGGDVEEPFPSRAPRPRRLVDDALEWPVTDEQAYRIADRAAPLSLLAAQFALDLMLEDEMAHGPPPGRTYWLSELIGGVGHARLSDRLAGLSGAITRKHLQKSWRPAKATTVGELAKIGEFASNRLFEHYDPRVQLAPLIAQAFLSSRGFPQTRAYELFMRPGLTGEDACKAYGAHKEQGCARAMTLGGLAALTGDTITPVTMFPVSHATWDDPDHEAFERRQRDCDAAAALAPFGLTPHGSVAGFAKYQFKLLQEARGILKRAAARRSPQCERYAVDPRRLLKSGMPNRVVIGTLTLGASAPDGAAGRVEHLPGLNAELLRVGQAHGIEVIAYAMDHMSDMEPRLFSQLKALSIASMGGPPLYGPELVQLLVGNGRWDVPGIDEIPAIALAAIGSPDVIETYGVDIDSKLVSYFRMQGTRSDIDNDAAENESMVHVSRAAARAAVTVRLTDPAGVLDVNLLARVTAREMIMWSTAEPLSGSAQTEALVTTELHYLTNVKASRQACLDRFFATFTPHRAQASSLKTRAYMWVTFMLANLGTVGHIRAEQGHARRP